ncbi:hypothetical protein V9K97_17745 [Variovorax sp. CCNWLW186]|uniref:hypothetical protein n=1 Tax=Variovorax sp. CCNWLW186 TaxID=3127473 RepID=UPI00307798BC
MPYLFTGVVLPERATFSLPTFVMRFSHLVSGVAAEATVSIVLNQISVRIDSAHDWDIFDLRNVVKTIIQAQLSLVGYLKGYAYDFAVTRVMNQRREIDYVFGIDVPCISGPRGATVLETAILELRGKTLGREGVFIQRCLADLVSALKNADDTGFYCYRAIETLRHHCAAVHGMTDAGKAEQWARFREISGVSEEVLREVKAAADPLRHGDTFPVGADSARVLTITWHAVDAYLATVPSIVRALPEESPDAPRDGDAGLQGLG